MRAERIQSVAVSLTRQRGGRHVGSGSPEAELLVKHANTLASFENKPDHLSRQEVVCSYWLDVLLHGCCLAERKTRVQLQASNQFVLSHSAQTFTEQITW